MVDTFTSRSHTQEQQQQQQQARYEQQPISIIHHDREMIVAPETYIVESVPPPVAGDVLYETVWAVFTSEVSPVEQADAFEQYARGTSAALAKISLEFGRFCQLAEERQLYIQKGHASMGAWLDHIRISRVLVQTSRLAAQVEPILIENGLSTDLILMAEEPVQPIQLQAILDDWGKIFKEADRQAVSDLGKHFTPEQRDVRRNEILEKDREEKIQPKFMSRLIQSPDSISYEKNKSQVAAPDVPYLYLTFSYDPKTRTTSLRADGIPDDIVAQMNHGLRLYYRFEGYSETVAVREAPAWLDAAKDGRLYSRYQFPQVKNRGSRSGDAILQEEQSHEEDEYRDDEEAEAPPY